MSQDQNEESKEKKIRSSKELGDEELEGSSGGTGMTGSIDFLDPSMTEVLGRLDPDPAVSITKLKR